MPEAKSWRAPVAVVDSVSLSLPSGSAPIIIDGYKLISKKRVLFTALSDPLKNNIIYEAMNVESAGGVRWDVEKDSSPTGLPVDGDTTYVQNGNVYHSKLFSFDGTQWLSDFPSNLIDASGVSSIDYQNRILSDFDGNVVARYSKGFRAQTGPTTSRPALGLNDAGVMFYDITLGAPIWWTGTSWITASGTVVGGGGGGGGGATILRDTFQGIDGTLLENHVMDVGSGWIPKLGGQSAIIQGNVLKASTVDPRYFSDAAVGNFIGTLKVTMNLSLADNQVILYCANDSSLPQGWAVVLEPVLNKFTLYENTTIRTVISAFGFVAGVQEWKVVIDSATTSVFRNSIAVASYAAPVSYGTNWGFELYKAAGAPLTTFSEFKLTNP